MDDIKGKCFWCKEEQTFAPKKMSDQNEHYVCRKCNATQSGYRLTQDNLKDK